MLDWIKEHSLEAVGVLLAALTYLEIGPSKLVSWLSGFNILIYLFSGALIGWGPCRAYHGFRAARSRQSNDELQLNEEQFRTSFAKCPYWIKVFLKTVLMKGTAYSQADDYHFQHHSQFLLQFVDYKTIANDVWQYSMHDDARQYFIAHSELLDDVKEAEIKRHARRTTGVIHVTSISDSFNWWYYSDEDYATRQ